jgi:hypothetical protein
VPEPDRLEDKRMTSQCSENLKQIPRSFVGDLTSEEQQDLDRHLAACSPCRDEHARYGETLQMLQCVGDEPVPRHFFVYPNERVANPWQLFRQLMPRWQAAAAAVAGLFLILGVTTLYGIQVRSDNGTWIVSFGRVSAKADIDVAALKADILKAADERNREAALGWIQDLRSEINNSRMDLTQQQQVQLVGALTGLESRINNRISATADELKAGAQKNSLDMYQAVSLQRDQDMGRINTRFDTVVENFDAKARQTDTILDTLLQIANLNLKQPGDQK